MVQHTAPIISISRHRINIDGPGIVTLVGFHGCQLNCLYCINQFIHRATQDYKNLTGIELFQIVKIDDIYFKASKGGITFGGGEPLLYVDFIEEFYQIIRKEGWTLNIESSLNAEKREFARLLPIVNNWIIDIKDLNDSIYKRYTGASSNQVITNLRILAEANLQYRSLIRVPLISGFNNNENRKKSVSILREMGFSRFDLFEYKTDGIMFYDKCKTLNL